MRKQSRGPCHDAATRVIEMSRGCRVITVSSGALKTIPGWLRTSLVVTVISRSLMPPDVRDWLPEGHLAWFVLDAVAGMDLGEFYGAYRG